MLKDGAKAQISAFPAIKKASLALAAALPLLASCNSTPKASIRDITPEPKKQEAAGKEYFAEAAYGVKASPRIVNAKRSRMPRGGGRDQVGKPYQVRGKWYYPKEEPGYSRSGQASWYGDAFHGRLTANGEIYDMNHLSAAHPTMPLPSYARVTNLKNGNSVIVRVNDRGPYAHGRIIDMSKRAAQLLDYASSGTAQVKVDYVGRAPLEGRDDEYLMASFQQGGAGPDTGLPEGVMVAMNGDTPSAVQAAAFPGEMITRKKIPSEPVAAQPVLAAFPEAPQQPASLLLPPDTGPAVPDRPSVGISLSSPELGYAARRIAQASAAFEQLTLGEVAGQPDYVLAGTFASGKDARKLAKALSAIGMASVEQTPDGSAWSVSLRAKSGVLTDDLLEAAWAAGADGAFVVRR